MNVSDLTKSLAEYSPTVNSVTDKIVAGVQPVAAVLIGIFFLIEMDSWWKTMSQEGGGLTQELWLQVAYKYLLAFFLVMMASPISSAIWELTNLIIHGIDHVFPAKSVDYKPELGKIKGWFFKQVLSLVAGLTEHIVGYSINLIMMMRMFEMALLKCVAPLIAASFMSDATRSMAINLLKYFGVAAFQGVIILIIVRLYPALVTDDLLKINVSDSFKSWSIAIGSIAKGIVFIFLLWGSQRKAKNLLAVM